jgi:hypothetical protein
MKLNRTVLYIALLSSLVVAALFATAAAAAMDPFKGVWYSIDGDGSNQRLTVGGGPDGMYRVSLFDDGATICGEDLSVAAFGTGQFSVLGNVLGGEFLLQCLASPPYIWSEAFYVSYTYNSGANTLTDSLGVTWYR